MDLARDYPEVIEELEKYVPGASNRLTTMKYPKPKYMTTSSEYSMGEKLTLEPRASSSTEFPGIEHPWPKNQPISSEHSTASKAKSKASGTEHKLTKV